MLASGVYSHSALTTNPEAAPEPSLCGAPLPADQLALAVASASAAYDASDAPLAAAIEEAFMMRRISLVFAVLPLVLGCSEDEDESSSEATMTTSTSSGGMPGAGGMMGASSDGGNGGSTTGDVTTGATTGAGSDICQRGCEATLEADCENGPETMDECMTDCEALAASDCGEEYAAFQTCAEGESISCQNGIPVVAACSSEQTAFIACINQ